MGCWCRSLGYEFPPEVNPADYLLDIIGGEVVVHDSSCDAHNVDTAGPRWLGRYLTVLGLASC